jgi:hypothetical protein
MEIGIEVDSIDPTETLEIQEVLGIEIGHSKGLAEIGIEVGEIIIDRDLNLEVVIQVIQQVGVTIVVDPEIDQMIVEVVEVVIPKQKIGHVLIVEKQDI